MHTRSTGLPEVKICSRQSSVFLDRYQDVNKLLQELQTDVSIIRTLPPPPLPEILVIIGNYKQHPLFPGFLKKTSRDYAPKIPPFPRKLEHACSPLMHSSFGGQGRTSINKQSDLGYLAMSRPAPIWIFFKRFGRIYKLCSNAASSVNL